MPCYFCEKIEKETELYTIRITKSVGIYAQTVDELVACKECINKNVLRNAEVAQNENQEISRN